MVDPDLCANDFYVGDRIYVGTAALGCPRSEGPLVLGSKHL